MLLPFSFLYWIGVELRNWFFDIGVLPTTVVAVPVISIGNLSIGGTGKTPLTEYVGGFLISSKKKVTILSRGYGRKTTGYRLVSDGTGVIATVEDVGDEPVQIARRLRAASVVVDENRVQGAQRAIREQKPDILVLDDGFQHRYLGRNVNVVLVTAEEIITKQFLLPAGNRREPLRSLHRADIIVVTKCSDLKHYEMAKSILQAKVSAPVVGFRLLPEGLLKVSTNEAVNRQSVNGKTSVTFSGIGSPGALRCSAEEFGLSVIGNFEFADHHWYSAEDLESLRSAYENSKPDFLVTTTKDIVRMNQKDKIQGDFLMKHPVCVLEVAPSFVSGEDVLIDLLNRVVA
jgi:tetraacyldisaccharide 4'-kinase